jgi:hypothetical protein
MHQQHINQQHPGGHTAERVLGACSGGGVSVSQSFISLSFAC